MCWRAGIFFPLRQPSMRYCRAVAHERGRMEWLGEDRCRRSGASSGVGRNLAQFGGIGLAGSISQPSSNWGIAGTESGFAAGPLPGRRRSNRASRAPDDSVKIALAEGNREYERRFSRIFIVCATGKSPAEILKILQRRMKNDEHTELQEASEQQRQITQIRLKKWLQG